MKSAEQLAFIFHSDHVRRAHGCLPFFVLLGALFLGSLLSVVRVVRPAGLKRPPIGTVYSRESDPATRFIVIQEGILPLLYPGSADLEPPDPPLPLTRELQPVPAPPLPTYPTAPDSAVLDTEKLLELPPEAGKEAP